MKAFLTYLKIITFSVISSIYLFQIFLTIKYSVSLGEISKKLVCMKIALEKNTI